MSSTAEKKKHRKESEKIKQRDDPKNVCTYE
jgi:hypothetical protein